MTTSTIIRSLFEIGAVNIDFAKGWILKDGSRSPIYINFRLVQSFPPLLDGVTALMVKKARADKMKYDAVAGIPFAAVPMGVAFALQTGIPHILPRMDGKDHGLKAKIDGVYTKGQKVLLIDDLITKATSKLEAVAHLQKSGLVVRDVMVILDRQQGGKAQLAKKRIKLHAVFTMDELLKGLRTNKKISADTEAQLRTYLKGANALG